MVQILANEFFFWRPSGQIFFFFSLFLFINWALKRPRPLENAEVLKSKLLNMYRCPTSRAATQQMCAEIPQVGPYGQVQKKWPQSVTLWSKN